MKRNQKGFTLMEMLIVVAIIAVLVAIAIPVYTAQMHKVRVAADKANIRAYYAQIQADYMLTEEKNSAVKVYGVDYSDFWTNITFLDGANVKLQAGKFGVVYDDKRNSGYEIIYYCNQNHPNCSLILG